MLEAGREGSIVTGRGCLLAVLALAASAAGAAFNDLFSAEAEFVADLSAAGRHKTLLFRDGKRLILAAWEPRGDRGARLALGAGKVVIRDLMGNPVEGRSAPLSTSPVFAIGAGMERDDFLANAVIWPGGR